MGVRFECPQGHKLHVKAHLAGQRGICPECGVRFIVPSFSGGRVAEAVNGDSGMRPANGSSSGYVSVDIESTATFNAGMPAPAATSDSAGESVTWYVRPASGGQYGPIDTAGFRQWIEEGRVAADAWVWRTGWTDWKPGGEAVRSIAVEKRGGPPPLPTTPGGRRLNSTPTSNSPAKRAAAAAEPRKPAPANSHAKPQPALSGSRAGGRFAAHPFDDDDAPVVTSSTTPALGFDLNSEFDELFASPQRGDAEAELLKPVIRVAARDQRMRRRKANQILTLVLAALALLLLVVLIVVMRRQNSSPTADEFADPVALTLSELESASAE
jgi:hypothetical protein